MKTIAHISDLHFGTELPVLAAALRDELQSNPPSLLVVSGDLTQRARRRQFSAARQYLDELPQPQLVVPGNHDVPLYDVVRRFLFPLTRYRKLVTDELDPIFEDGDLFVAGLNSARSLTWKSGRLSLEQIEALRARLLATRAAFKIVVTHHPFIPPPKGSSEARIDLVGRAAQALAVLDAGKVDLLLAGHLHHGYSGDTRPYYPGNRAIVSAQAGTVFSRRVRPSDPNGYNRITLNGNSIRIEVRTWQERRFESLRTTHYQRVEDGWHIVE
ncbi:metallophosphoesterase family protein [Oleiharenicola lentus]|uniref:metallophosphoesterase family protein n=1 Tax=Oleiharenicola lentus TaxID=2508720 RepID=UPI003F6729AF